MLSNKKKKKKRKSLHSKDGRPVDFKACRLFGHRPRSLQIINLMRIIIMRTSSVTNIVIKCTFSIDKLGRAEVHDETGTTVEFFVFIFVPF